MIFSKEKKKEVLAPVAVEKEKPRTYYFTSGFFGAGLGCGLMEARRYYDLVLQYRKTYNILPGREGYRVTLLFLGIAALGTMIGHGADELKHRLK